MGEVYKARDTRLGRSVAIKVLHPSLAADPSFNARFVNEARTLSQIAHPNICVLHDVGEGQPTYIVLEYLEGQTLADRIARGPLAFDEVRRIAVEICRALDTAHRAGIVHRDLKPANVMLTKSGAKLLDFGLAREHRGDAADATATMALTKAGTVLGTAAYMAPEQLQGQRADARSDIFALGATLHEAATGRRAFDGQTSAAVAGAILSTDPPPPSTLRPELPPAFDAIVQGCLAKEPDARWQSAHDVGRQLETLSSLSGAQTGAAGRVSTASSYVPWIVTALAIGIAIAALAWRRPAAPAAGETVVFEIAPPPDTSLIETVEGNAMALSPDGSQLAWVGVDADRRTRIWLRPLAQLDSRPLPGTEGALTLFWSPEGRAIAFFSNGLLQRLDLQGTTAVTICPVQSGAGHTGTWGADGRILFAPIQGEGIYSVSTTGGAPQKVISANRSAGEHRIGWPSFLADGRTFVYLVRVDAGVSWIMLARPGRDPQRVAEIPTEAQYVDAGYLVFGRNGALLAQRLDIASARLTGDPAPLASKVRLFAASGWGGFSASRSGTIAFVSSVDQTHLAWTDAAGKVAERVGTAGNYLDVRLTPDGRNALMSRLDANSGVYDIWSVDLARGTEERVTSGPSTNIAAMVLADGKSMIYSKSTGGGPELVRRTIASGAEERLAPAVAFQQAVSITRNGRTLVYLQRADQGNWDIWTLSLEGARTPAPLIATAFNEYDARLSPDDRLLAFVSNDTGRSEIYIAPFPQAAPKYRVSTQGGRLPRWAADRTLMYLSNDGRLMRAEVTTDGGIRAGTPTSKFPAPPKAPWRDFLPLPDGRVLAIVTDSLARDQPMTVITNAVR
jgi:Tol biopolymer transport system component/tRNA A-37 threonylcarbamoyl transferase component Bud32